MHSRLYYASGVTVAPQSSICPHCGQRAPVVLRGVETRCVACGQRRPPLVGANVTLAGQPSRWGGTLAHALGWVLLVVGSSLAAFLWLLLQSIWPHSFVGWAFALPVMVVSWFFGLFLVIGGRRLRKQGDATQRGLRFEAIRALAAHRGGSLTAADAAHALKISDAESDALLTELAKDPDANVSLEVDDDGRIVFLFGIPEKRWRVLEQTAEQADAAVEAEATSYAGRSERAKH